MGLFKTMRHGASRGARRRARPWRGRRLRGRCWAPPRRSRRGRIRSPISPPRSAIRWSIFRRRRRWTRSTPATAPQLEPGTPFDDLFEEFFRRRQQGKGGADQESPQPPHERRSNSLGSGFVIDPSGIIITNNHVIADANDVTVIFTNGQKLKAEVIGKDSKVDVAVLRVKPDKPLKAAKFGDSEKMRVGDWVVAVGNPFGLGGTVTAGIISARNRNIDSGPYDNYFQTDAAINKGNSGGPLFNMDGEVIGINTAILSPSGGSIGIGFSTPSATVEPVIEQLQKFGETRRGWLGVRIQNVDDTIAESLNLGSVRGALVAGTDDNGPAKAGGLQAGDVILKFDGVEIKESHDLPKIVASAPVGKDVEVVLLRQGKQITKTIKLGRLEDNEKQKAEQTAKADDARKAAGHGRGRQGAGDGVLQPRRRRAAKICDQAGRRLRRRRDQCRSRFRRCGKTHPARRNHHGDQSGAGQRAGRRRRQDRRAEKRRQEIGSSAGRQRAGRDALRRAVLALTPAIRGRRN